MQTDDLRDVPFLEVTLHRISHIRPDGLERIALGEDRLADGPGGETALCRFFHDKHDLDHGRVPASRPVTKGMWCIHDARPANVGATRDTSSLVSRHPRETAVKLGLCPYPFPYQIWFAGDAVLARSQTRRRREGS